MYYEAQLLRLLIVQDSFGIFDLTENIECTLKDISIIYEKILIISGKNLCLSS